METVAVPEDNRGYVRIKKISIVIFFVILAAGSIGWWLGQPHRSSTAQVNNASQPTITSTATNMDVKSLVSYVLPDGWSEASCPAASKAILIMPAGGASVNCNTNPTAAVKILVDPTNSKDCNDLKSVQDVKKHTCISQYINGKKSLKSSTEYLATSSYKQDTTVNSYYVNTGKGVIEAQYIYSDDNQAQAGFDQLAQSIKTKN